MNSVHYTYLSGTYNDIFMYLYKSEFQILSFIFIPFFKRCPLCLKLTTFVLIFLKSCMLCHLALTQLDFFVKSDHSRII
ncbi:hypothetical protein Hanom_Chr06g00568541 [Helianthus anomalus]